MTIFEIIILGYRIALGALLLCILWQGTTAMQRTIVAILGIYLAQLGLAELLWPSPWWSAVMIPVDALGAAIITFHPAGRMQSLIGLTFLPQMALHLGRFINSADADMNQYFWGLSVLGFAQLVLCGGWWIYERTLRYSRHRAAHPVVVKTAAKAVGP